MSQGQDGTGQDGIGQDRRLSWTHNTCVCLHRVKFVWLGIRGLISPDPTTQKLWTNGGLGDRLGELVFFMVWPLSRASTLQGVAPHPLVHRLHKMYFMELERDKGDKAEAES